MFVAKLLQNSDLAEIKPKKLKLLCIVCYFFCNFALGFAFWLLVAIPTMLNHESVQSIKELHKKS